MKELPEGYALSKMRSIVSKISGSVVYIGTSGVKPLGCAVEIMRLCYKKPVPGIHRKEPLF